MPISHAVVGGGYLGLKHFMITSNTRSSAIAEGPRDASCQLKSCQLPRNSAETVAYDKS